MKVTKQIIEHCMVLSIDDVIDKLYENYNKKYPRELIRSKFLKSKTCNMILDDKTKYWGEAPGFLCDEFKEEIKKNKALQIK